MEKFVRSVSIILIVFLSLSVYSESINVENRKRINRVDKVLQNGNTKILFSEANNRYEEERDKAGEIKSVSGSIPDGDYYYLTDIEKVYCTFLNGLRSGNWKKYSLSGGLKEERTYEEGKEEGLEKVYYDNGNLYFEYDYRKGKKQGKGSVFHDSGIKAQEGSFKDDLREGLWDFFNNQGNKIFEIKYQRGKELRPRKAFEQDRKTKEIVEKTWNDYDYLDDAIGSNDLELFTELLSDGVSPNARLNNQEHRILTYVFDQGNKGEPFAIELFKRGIKLSNGEEKDNNYEPDIFRAISNDYSVSTLIMMIKKGADINKKWCYYKDYCESPLSYSIKENKKNIAGYLRKIGAK
ncbi:hypothetical protein K0V43_19565, partial [Leptospira sp. id769339]|nr:hypothetical protein [Leptospira sp. id769339]